MRETAPEHSEPLDLRNVVETIPALVVCALPDGSVQFVNRAWQEYTGHSQQLNDSDWQTAVHPEDLAKFGDEWSVALSAGKPFETEARLQGADGQYRWFLVKKALAVSGTQNRQPSLHTLIAFEDINERKQSRAKLQQSEERYRVLIETAIDAVICADESGTIQFANPSTLRIFGYHPIELIGRPLTVLMPEFMRNEHENGFSRYLSTGQRQLKWQGTELTGLRQDGKEFPIEVSLGELISDGHRIFTAFIRDISEQKQAQESLRRSESYLAQAQKLAHIGSWVWEVAGRRYLYLSEEWYRIYGFDPTAAAPSWEERLQRVHPEDRVLWQAAIDRAIAEKSDYDVQFRIFNPGEPVRFIHSVGRPILSPSGELQQFVGVAMDITERKRAEEERQRLRQAETDLAHISRVNMMGHLTASLAHEINQPIGAAVANAEACLQFLDRDRPDVDEAREAALEMATDARRAAAIIDRVRSLYRKDSSRQEIVDLNEVIREMLLILHNQASRYSVTIRTELAEKFPSVTADRVQLQQVLMNLMLNGIEAMRDRTGELVIKSQIAEAGQLLISVIDAGMGLPAGKEDEIFNAFFTTKSQGTGLGLAITRSIVESHGGRVWATKNSGPGATFQFTLPGELVVAA